MARNMIKRSVGIAALVLGLAAALTATIQAKPAYLARAKELGYDAKNCKYCHTKASGGAGWNERGKWLFEQKKARRAKDVDVAWLKDYKGS